MSTYKTLPPTSKYVSLYVFYGKPVGKEFGLRVAKAAALDGVKTRTRHVRTSSYQGTVELCPYTYLSRINF